MSVKDFVKNELKGWGRYERVLFPLEILLITGISFYTGDSKIALISAICGISYTILAGKGKISCYIFGLSGTMFYAYLAFVNALYGNVLLYLCCYFPMQIAGIFKWKKHLNKESHEIIKTSLNTCERIACFAAAIIFSAIFSLILKKSGDASPFIDGTTTVFSIIGLLLTIKRCIEQWYVWLVVNGLSVVMWIEAYIHGSNCLATIIMWATYFILGLYFLFVWSRDLRIISEKTRHQAQH